MTMLHHPADKPRGTWLGAALQRVVHALEPPGRPPGYRSVWGWLGAGCARQPWGIIVGLLAAWTGLPIALWLGAFYGVGGGIAGVVLALQWSPTQALAAAGAGPVVVVVAAVGGFLLGALGGLVYGVGAALLSQPMTTLVAVLSGAILAVLIVGITVLAESKVLRLQGYERLSSRERARVQPLLEGIAQRMGHSTVPFLRIGDNPLPRTWAYPRTIVITTGLLVAFDDAELTGVLAHELYHWAVGDPVGLLAAWAAGWPVGFLYNLGGWLSGGVRSETRRSALVGGGGGLITVGPPTLLSAIRFGVVAFGWLILWPSWVLTRFVLAPIIAAASRGHEFEADAAAARAGYGNGLAAALTQLQVFEGARTGWEAAIAAHHPRTEERLAALERLAPEEDDVAA